MLLFRCATRMGARRQSEVIARKARKNSIVWQQRWLRERQIFNAQIRRAHLPSTEGLRVKLMSTLVS